MSLGKYNYAFYPQTLSFWHTVFIKLGTEIIELPKVYENGAEFEPTFCHLKTI